MKNPIITIWFDKNWNADFGVNGSIDTLTIGQLNRLRAMTSVAIYVSEDVWRRGNPWDKPQQLTK